MADKSIFDLTTQATFANDDRLVIGNYANNDARAITGADMVAQLTALANGHGGINSITSVDSSLDGGTNVITVTMADGTTASFNVKNGSKGSTGAQTYVYIRYAHTQPTADADMGTTPDEWIGIVSTTATTAPTTYTSYTWYQFKGATGATGAAASITTQTVEYQSGASGTTAPTGAWSSSVPAVAQGAYLWTRTTLAFNDGTSVVSYSVGRMGIDGAGSVSTVNNVSVDTGTTNITLEGSDIPIDSNNTANVAVVTDASGILIPSSISTTELNMLSGANNNIQTQLNSCTSALYLTSVACSAMTGDFASVSNASITADYVVAECVFANPEYIQSNVTWTSASGSLTLNGTCSAATTANIVLIKKNN